MTPFGIAIRLPSLQGIKDHPGVTLMLASSLVSMTRWADAWNNAAGFSIRSDLWNYFHMASGIGLAVIEPLTVFYCARALSRSKRSVASTALLIMMVVSVLCLFVIGTPVVLGGMSGSMVKDVLHETWLRVVWGGAITLSNLLLLASAGIADHLNTLKAKPEYEIRIRKPDINVERTVRKLAAAPTISLPPSTALTLNDENFLTVWDQTAPEDRSSRKLAQRFTFNGKTVSHTAVQSYIKRLVKE